MRNLLLSVLTLILLFIFVQPANAQIKKGSWIWTLCVGYAPLTSKITGNSLDGWLGATTVEKLIGNSNWSLGMNLTFFNAEDKDAMINMHQIAQSYNTTAMYVGTKYFVTTMGEWVPYFGLALGVHWSTRYTAVSAVTVSQAPDVITGNEHKTSYAFSAPIGINWFVSDEVFLGFNLTSVWMNDTYYSSDVNLLMNLTIGFQIN